MIDFIAFALYLTVATFLLVFVPVMLHPTLKLRRKLLLLIAGFVFIVPGGLALYATLGVPPMGAL